MVRKILTAKLVSEKGSNVIVHFENISNRSWNQFVMDILRKIFRHKIMPDIDPFFEWIFTKIHMVCIGRHGRIHLFYQQQLWFSSMIFRGQNVEFNLQGQKAWFYTSVWAYI